MNKPAKVASFVVAEKLDFDGWHYVYGPVYSPLQIDTDGESMTKEDVKQLAHEFVARGLADKIDISHNKIPSGAVVVESWLSREGDLLAAKNELPEGTWMLGVRVPEGALWEDIKSGKLNGFSFDAMVQKSIRRVTVDIAKIVIGETEANSDIEVVPGHVHDFYVEFNSEGRVTLGFTDNRFEHIHQILGTVTTEEELGHTHRFGV